MQVATCLLANIEGDNSNALFTVYSSEHRMAGAANNVMRLLLFALICVKGKDGLIFPERGFKIVFPCEEDLVCLQEWNFWTTSDYIAIVINGKMQTADSKDDDSKCALKIKDPTEVVGSHQYSERPDVISRNTMSDLTLTPGKSMSMQCILLRKGHCYAGGWWTTLVWLDEAGRKIQGDSQHLIKKSDCDTTLTVKFQSPGNKKYWCKATVDGQHFWRSVELRVRVSDAQVEDGPIFPGRGYGIVFPCEEDLVCLYEWFFRTISTSDYIAIVINGEMQRAESDSDASKCALQIEDLTEVVGRRRCRKNTDVISPSNAISDFILIPGKSMSMQCILLQRGGCLTRFWWVELVWLDGAGAEVQEDSQHQIKRNSRCDTTLTVTFQSPANKTFRCKATVDGEVSISEELRVRVPAPKGKGRGLPINPQPENPYPGGEWSTMAVSWIAVGVAGCVVLTALAAAFIVRRRMSNQRPGESHAAYNDTSADDVVYADLSLPDVSGKVWDHESTEYSCVKPK